MVSDTDTPKSSVQSESFTQRESYLPYHVDYVLLNQGFQVSDHRLLDDGLGAFEIMFQSGILFVGKQSCLGFTVKLKHVITHVV